MPQILYDHTRINAAELLQHSDLINNILSRTLRYPNVKKLAGSKYNNEDVFRAKTDKKNRLIYTYILHNENKTLLILALNDHNYGQVKRQLRSKNPGNIRLITIEEDPYKDAPEPTSDKLSVTPAVSYNRLTLALDDSQQKAMLQKTPLILNGPPGAGKTVILYNLMLKILNAYSLSLNSDLNTDTAEQPATAPVLFLSQSEHLISSLKEQHQVYQSKDTSGVLFTTWQSLLMLHHPDLKLIEDNEFSLWLKDKLPKEASDVIHYEFSLIVALGTKSYMNLGNRQCYYSKNSDMQNKLIDLLARWQQHLKEHQLLDPMVTRINLPQNHQFLSVFCDEAQNLPPVALCDLILSAKDQRFVACLDSEQCLISSPYILSCLKELMHQHYGAYSEQPLPKTWRCRPKVAEVANTLMQVKYSLDGGGKRRNYHSIESMHSSGGMVSWINSCGMAKIREFGTLTGTVVIAEHLESGDREFINNHLNTNHILTAKQAIGLDFDRVILWKPFSGNKCFHELLQKIKKPGNTELTLEQWNTLNALYVSITRSQSDVFVHEPSKRWMELGEHFLGQLPLNQLSASIQEQNSENEQLKWEHVIEHHLSEGRIAVARELMHFHLKLDSTAIEEKINARKSVPSSTAVSTSTPGEIIPQKNDLPKEKALDTNASPKKTKSSSKRKKHNKKNSAAQTKQLSPNKNQIPKDKSSIPHESSIALKPSTAALNSPKISPCDAYIHSLLNQLNEKSIINLFKHKSAAKLLFQHPLKDGTCLFTKLINNPTYRDLIFQLINKHWSALSKAFTPEILCQTNPPQDIPSIMIFALHPTGRLILNMVLNCHSNRAQDIKLSTLTYIPKSDAIAHNNASTFYWLLAYIDGRKFVNKLLDLNPELGKNLDDTFLNYSPGPKTTGAGEIIAPIYWIASSTIGLTLFTKLLAQNPRLGQTISGKSLCRKRTIPNSIETNSSALYWLTSSALGREVLNVLLDLNSQLAQEITAKALCRPLTPHAEINANISGLFWLFSTSGGRVILDRLLTLNPDLAKGISGEALCNRRAVSIGKNAHHSPLSYASSTPEGIALVNKLLDLNSELAKEISAESICYILQQIEEDDSSTSIFSVLTSSPAGRQLLLRLVDENPDLAKGITGNTLCAALNSNARFNPNTSPLYWLSANTDGRVLLKKLLDNNPNLAKEIRAKELCQILKEPTQAKLDTSPLFWLCGQKDGRDMLKRLIEVNHELARSITAEALCHFVSSPDDPEYNSSPLFWLAANSDGRELLNQLLDLNPDLALSIDSTVLFLERPLNAVPMQGNSSFFWLLTDAEGIRALTRLCKTNPSIAQCLNRKILCTARPPDVCTFANISPLYLFAKHGNGQILFYQILNENPTLIQAITADDLSLMIETEDNGVSALSALYWFSNTTCGRTILLKLLEKNQAIAQGITALALCNQRDAGIGKYAKTSALSWLSTSAFGHKILNIILEQNPSIAKEITEEFLCQECSVAVQNNFKASPLSLLLKSKDGEQFLNQLVNNNPGLEIIINKQKSLNDEIKPVTPLSFFSHQDNQMNNTHSDLNESPSTNTPSGNTS
ncbi:hypothetical protein Lmor_1668 [Legionella moravica]|uniref:Ankyrin repeats (3 copies) n=1 Tax=Legionella moravica TaxID=39962 RepID=A0A378JX72_9GAMM|nr:hypothetical protein [Legionella moravica]KTD34271.1 hypothetical protein Lmor_1668 [Legionella moravica]STX63263.1 Uncharacterised protein [Legionella moravica]